LKGIFDVTSFCPFTSMCESYQTIGRSEQWMSKALSNMRRTGLDILPLSEGGYTALMLENKLLHMRRIKDRCYQHNKRCLKFWQFKRHQESGISSIEQQNIISILGNMNNSSPILEPPV